MEKILSEQRSLHEYLEKEAERAIQGEFAAQTRSSEFQAEMDRREWEKRYAEDALYETSRQLETQKMELCQAHEWTDQARRQKRWSFGELDEEFAVWKRIELDIFGFVCDLRRKRRGSTIEN